MQNTNATKQLICGLQIQYTDRATFANDDDTQPNLASVKSRSHEDTHAL